MMVAVGESGAAQIFKLKIDMNNNLIEKQKRGSILNQSLIPTVDFVKVKEFQAHEINLQKDQSVIGVKFILGEAIFCIFTNHGVVKLFSSTTYDHVATLNDAAWDYSKLERALDSVNQPRELTFS